MCLVSPRPAWEEDVTFAPRPSGHRHSNSRRHVSETITTRRRDPPPVTYIEMPPPPPRVSTPIVVAPPPPPAPRPLTPPPPQRIVEFISVQESPPHVSVSVSEPRHHKRRKSRSERGEEVYIERERERVIRAPSPQVQREEFETFRYVNGPDRVVTEEVVVPQQRRIAYESSPRGSATRVVHERERVVEREDGGRRGSRQYHR